MTETYSWKLVRNFLLVVPTNTQSFKFWSISDLGFGVSRSFTCTAFLKFRSICLQQLLSLRIPGCFCTCLSLRVNLKCLSWASLSPDQSTAQELYQCLPHGYCGGSWYFLTPSWAQRSQGFPCFLSVITHSPGTLQRPVLSLNLLFNAVFFPKDFFILPVVFY